jgi:hypothetical protein
VVHPSHHLSVSCPFLDGKDTTEYVCNVPRWMDYVHPRVGTIEIDTDCWLCVKSTSHYICF